MTPEAILAKALFLKPGREDEFDALARAAFSFQVAHNPVYARFAREHVWESYAAAPYLPVAAFKEADVAAFPPATAEHVFLSSATGSGGRSRHYVRSLDVYRRALRTGFRARFGTGPFTILGHLPRYVDQAASSSLVFMVEDLIATFGDRGSGLFLDDVQTLEQGIARSRASGSTLLLFGAAFGLLDLLEQGPLPLPDNARVVETGGMKTHRREIARAELHHRLSEGFAVPRARIHSEYGMCELMSQCYTSESGRFQAPPWMRCRVVDPTDPHRAMPLGHSGALAIFDLASVYTVSAILTQDRAVQHEDGFEVQGRLSGVELRGCNFLVAADAPKP